MKKLPVNELLRLACYYGEQDRETYLDCIKDAGDQEDIDRTKRLISQFRTYRHKRWGKSRGEQIIAESKPCALADIKQETSSFNVEHKTITYKVPTPEEIELRQLLLKPRQKSALQRLCRAKDGGVMIFHHCDGLQCQLVRLGLAQECTRGTNGIVYAPTAKGRAWVQVNCPPSDAQTEGWVNVLTEKPKGKTLVEVFTEEAKALAKKQADLLLKVYNHPGHVIIGIEEFSDHFKPLVEKGMLGEEDADEGYVRLFVTTKGKEYLDLYLYKPDSFNEAWSKVIQQL